MKPVINLIDCFVQHNKIIVEVTRHIQASTPQDEDLHSLRLVMIHIVSFRISFRSRRCNISTFHCLSLCVKKHRAQKYGAVGCCHFSVNQDLKQMQMNYQHLILNSQLFSVLWIGKCSPIITIVTLMGLHLRKPKINKKKCTVSCDTFLQSPCLKLIAIYAIVFLLLIRP